MLKQKEKLTQRDERVRKVNDVFVTDLFNDIKRSSIAVCVIRRKREITAQWPAHEHTHKRSPSIGGENNVSEIGAGSSNRPILRNWFESSYHRVMPM